MADQDSVGESSSGSGSSSNNSVVDPAPITDEALGAVPSVVIDKAGVFKYILIQCESKATGATKTVLRGHARFEYHDDIFQDANPALEGLGISTQCVGGGRISHGVGEILVYGYSQAYGRGDHALACELLRAAYPSYNKEKIIYRNEGY